MNGLSKRKVEIYVHPTDNANQTCFKKFEYKELCKTDISGTLECKLKAISQSKLLKSFLVLVTGYTRCKEYYDFAQMLKANSKCAQYVKFNYSPKSKEQYGDNVPDTGIRMTIYSNSS